MTLPENLLELLRKPSPCFLSTIVPDGSPPLTETWVDTDGDQIIINTVVGFVKVRNVGSDPRVALAIQDPAKPFRYTQVRGEARPAACHPDDPSEQHQRTRTGFRR